MDKSNLYPKDASTILPFHLLCSEEYGEGDDDVYEEQNKVNLEEFLGSLVGDQNALLQLIDEDNNEVYLRYVHDYEEDFGWEPVTWTDLL